MLILVYQYGAPVSRSLLSANLIAEVEADNDTDVDAVVAQHGGDFAEVLAEEFV